MCVGRRRDRLDDAKKYPYSWKDRAGGPRRVPPAPTPTPGTTHRVPPAPGFRTVPPAPGSRGVPPPPPIGARIVSVSVANGMEGESGKGKDEGPKKVLSVDWARGMVGVGGEGGVEVWKVGEGERVPVAGSA